MRSRNRLYGYSLLETMFVLAVGLVLLTAGAPVLSSLIYSSRVQAGTQALASSLSLARSEAIKRHARVVMCKSKDGVSCDRSTGWEGGWIVFQDTNNDAEFSEGESLLLREHGLPEGLRLSGNAPLRNYVSYTPHGRTATVGGAFQAGTFTVCADEGRRLWGSQVVINNNGRVRLIRSAGAACA